MGQHEWVADWEGTPARQHCCLAEPVPRQGQEKPPSRAPPNSSMEMVTPTPAISCLKVTCWKWVYTAQFDNQFDPGEQKSDEKND